MKSMLDSYDELTADLQRQADTLRLEKDTALLELKQGLQNRLEEQQAKHSSAISEYEEKVKNLLSMLEQSKATPSESRGKSQTSKKASSTSKPTDTTE